MVGPPSQADHLKELKGSKRWLV
jgi:hypothetical protein